MEITNHKIFTFKVTVGEAVYELKAKGDTEREAAIGLVGDLEKVIRELKTLIYK